MQKKDLKYYSDLSIGDRTEQTFISIKDELSKSAARKVENISNHGNGEMEPDISLVIDDEIYAQADIIIEATEENITLKANLLKELQNVIKEDCLLGSITSFAFTNLDGFTC